MKTTDKEFTDTVSLAKQQMTFYRLGGIGDVEGSKENVRDLAYALVEAVEHIESFKKSINHGILLDAAFMDRVSRTVVAAEILSDAAHEIFTRWINRKSNMAIFMNSMRAKNLKFKEALATLKKEDKE